MAAALLSRPYPTGHESNPTNPIPLCVPRRATLARASLADDYDLDARTVELDLSDGTRASAYLTEERETDRRPRASRAIVLLPDASGGPSARTRSLADRLAVFCFAMVLVPELSRDGTGASAADALGTTTAATAVSEAWASSLPPRRVASDVRDWAIYLRADHRVGPVALAGVGHGAPLALRAMSADGPMLPVCSGVAVCAPRVMRDELAALQAPVLCLFDRTHARDDALAASARTFLDAATTDLVAAAATAAAATAAAAAAAAASATAAAAPAAAAAAAAGAAGGVSSASSPPPSALTVDVVNLADGTEPAPAPSGLAPSSSRHLSIAGLRRLRVTELRAQLNARGLPTDGLKAKLVERLWTAVQQGDGVHGGEGGGTAGEDKAPNAKEAGGATAATAASPPPSPPISSPSAPSPMVLQFRGLEHALARLVAKVATDASAAAAPPEASATPTGADADGSGEESARDTAGDVLGITGGGFDADEGEDGGEDEGEDGLIMAEAWLNLHLDRTEKKMATVGR